MTTRAAYFSPSEAEILMEAYEEVKEEIKTKGNTATAIKQREKAWQSIADRLNASNMIGPRRTWQQVKIKYKNILQNAVKKNVHKMGTGRGSSKADLTQAEDLALTLNKGRPVLEGIPGATETNVCPFQDATRLIQVRGSNVTLLEPPAPASPTPADAGPCEGTSAAAAAAAVAAAAAAAAATAAAAAAAAAAASAAFDFDVDETISLGSIRNENSQVIRQLHAQHLQRQIQLADLGIQYKKRKIEDLLLESEIKRKTIRKLDLEIKKLEREVQEHDKS
ncbi:uncharacterized protein LOC142893852 isoform X2 [Nelusetta ayraudi]|uniref:uncharacterized protein LOC142893852 isoform X2 n=1 Tax=Nelusetta ayraudi TaxID=303726 RepID=UPI003F722F4B